MAAAYVFFLYASAYICIYIHLFHWNIDIDFHKSLGKLFDWWRRVDSKPLNSGRSGYLLRCFCLALVRLPRLATPWSFLMGFWALQPDSSTMTSTEHCWFCFVFFIPSLLFSRLGHGNCRDAGDSRRYSFGFSWYFFLFFFSKILLLV